MEGTRPASPRSTEEQTEARSRAWPEPSVAPRVPALCGMGRWAGWAMGPLAGLPAAEAGLLCGPPGLACSPSVELSCAGWGGTLEASGKVDAVAMETERGKMGRGRRRGCLSTPCSPNLHIRVLPRSPCPCRCQVGGEPCPSRGLRLLPGPRELGCGRGASRPRSDPQGPAFSAGVQARGGFSSIAGHTHSVQKSPQL